MAITSSSRMALAVFALLVGTATTTPALASPLYRLESLASSGSGEGEARAINAAGDIVGAFDGSAFVWHAGTLAKIASERSSDLGDTFTSIATAINRSGFAAGSDGAFTPCSMSGLELASAVTFVRGEMHFVDGPSAGSCSFEVDGIDDRGTLVGEDGFRGFVRYADGRQVEIEPLSRRPENNGTRASAIDNEGRIVGGTTIDVPNVPRIEVGEERSSDGSTVPVYGPDISAYRVHAFLLKIDARGQHMRDLGAIVGFPNTYATAIGEDGTIVGYSGTTSGPKWSRVGGPSHAWVWQNGRMTDIGRASKGDSFAYGVNAANVIVGCAGDDAVRWVDKKIQDLNALIAPRSGWHVTCARAINRDGIIVGSATRKDGRSLPVRLVPIATATRQ